MSSRHPGFARMFQPGRLTLGVFFPIEAFEGANPTMSNQVALARRASDLGFAALWFRDVPLLDPHFGDVGQIYDPWTYLGYIAAQTEGIALATGSIVLPLRHPLHVAKAAASIDVLSGGRLVLGVASGDRPVEFPAFGKPFETRGEAFRESLLTMRRAWRERFPVIHSSQGSLSGADLVPKPVHGDLPVMITGRAQQPLEWIAQHADAWIMYPQPLPLQAIKLRAWLEAQARLGIAAPKPFGQSLYIDLVGEAGARQSPIHLGFRLGRRALVAHLRELQELGVGHVVLNLKYGSRDAAEVLDELGQEVLPHFRQRVAAPALATP
jgi:luciferase-type oxidoreductase